MLKNEAALRSRKARSKLKPFFNFGCRLWLWKKFLAWKKYFLLILWGWKWRFEKYILGCDCWLKICLTSRSMSSSMISWLRRAPLGTGHTLTTSPEPNTNILTYFSQKTRSLETVVQFSLSIDSKLTRYWTDFHGTHPHLTSDAGGLSLWRP